MQKSACADCPLYCVSKVSIYNDTIVHKCMFGVFFVLQTKGVVMKRMKFLTHFFWQNSILNCIGDHSKDRL